MPSSRRTPTAPGSVRALSRLVGAARLDPVLEPRAMMRAAERATGLADWGETDVFDDLRGLTDALREEGRLTPFGRVASRKFVSGNLRTRLRVVDTLARYREPSEVRITRPVVVVGWYRTGTTFLHDLLDAAPAFRAPHLWELRDPAGPPGRLADLRRQWKARAIAAVQRFLAPSFRSVHRFEWDRPEECLFLFEPSIVTPTVLFISEAQGYGRQLGAFDPSAAYRLYRDQLGILAWRRPGGRWALKWPYHMWHLDALLATFPDATVVHLHRDPEHALSSICSFATITRAPFVETIDRRALGRFWLEHNALGAGRALDVRTRSGDARFVDVYEHELRNDPLRVASRIAHHAGVTLDECDRASMRHFVDAQRAARTGTHRHRVQDFGIDPDEVRERFARYLSAFPGVSDDRSTEHTP